MRTCKCGGAEFHTKLVTTANVKVTSASGTPEFIAGSSVYRGSDFMGSFTCASCGEVYLDIADSDDGGRITRRCSCGNTTFTAHQVCYHDVIVNSDSIFLRDDGVNYAENPYGSYTCTRCFKEYEALDGLAAFAIKNESGNSNPAEEPGAEQVFTQNKIAEIPRHALRLEWEALSDIFGRLLTGLFRRELGAEALREEYYYWIISLSAPITAEELESLLSIAEASEYNRDEFICDEGDPVMEFTQGLCSKLMNKLLPFPLESTRADDEGVWFIRSTQ